MGEIEQSAGSADKEMGIIQESLDYKINAFKETWTGIFQNLIDRGTIGGIIDFLTTLSGLIEKITSNSDALAFAVSGIISAFAQFKGDFNSLDFFKSIGEFFINKGKNSIPDPTSLFEIPFLSILPEYEDIHDKKNQLEDMFEDMGAGLGEALRDGMGDALEESDDWQDALDDFWGSIQEETSAAEELLSTYTINDQALTERIALEQGVAEAVSKEAIAQHQSNEALMQKVMSEKNLSIEEKQLMIDETKRLAVLQAENTAEAKTIIAKGEEATEEEKLRLAVIRETASRYALTDARMAEIASMIKTKIARNEDVTQIEREILATYEHISVLKQEQTQSALTAKALTALKSIGSMLVTSLITYGIMKLVELFNDWAHESEKVAENAKKARDEIDNLQKSFKDLKKNTDGVKQRYAELAQGVKNIGTAFQSQGTLSNDEYQEFLSISDQLAGLYPQLTKGYDDNGRAIIGLSGNVDTIVGSLNEYIKAAKDAANFEIWEKSDDLWGGLQQQIDDMEDRVKDIKDEANALKNISNMISNKDTLYLKDEYAWNNLKHGLNYRANLMGTLFSRAGINATDIETGKYGIEWGYDFSKLTEEQIQKLKIAYRQLILEYQKENNNLRNEITSQISDTHDIIFSWLESQSEDYEKIGAIYGDEGQKIIQELLNNIDPNILISNIKNMSKEQFIGWLDSEYLQPLLDLSEEGKDIILQGMTADGNRAELLQQYQKIIDYLMAQPGFSPDDPLYLYFTDKIVDVSNDVNAAYDKIVGDTNLQDKPKEVVRDWIKELSDEEYDLVMNAEIDPTGYSKESLDKWLANLQAMVDANPVDVSISDSIKQLSTQMDPYFDEIGSFYQKIFAEGYDKLDKSVLDNDTLNSLRSRFEEIADEVGVGFDPKIIDNFWHELENAPDSNAAHDAINNLATEWLNATDTLKTINDDTAKYIETQLKNWGVRNAEEVVKSRLDMNNAERDAQALLEEMRPTLNELEEAQEELNNADEDSKEASEAKVASLKKEIAAMYEKAEASEFAKIKLFELRLQEQGIELNNIDASTDVAEILKIAKACGITSNALSALQTYEENISKLGANGMDTAAMEGMRRMYTEQLAAELDLTKLLEGAEIEMTDAASSAGSGAGEELVDAFQAELDNLQWLYDNDLIDTKTYLDQKRALIERMWKDGTLDAKAYFEKIHAWLREMLDLYNQVISDVTKILDKEIDKLNKERDARIKALEEERDAQLDVIDKELEALDKRIKKRQEEIDAMEKEHEARKQTMDLMKAEYELQRSLNQRTNLVKICQAS